MTPKNAPYRVRVTEMILEVTFGKTNGLGKVLNFHDAKLDMYETFSSKLWNKFSFSFVLTVLFYIPCYLISQILFLYKKFSKFAFFY